MTTQQEVEREFYEKALATAKTGAASTGYGMPVNQRMRFVEWDRQVPISALGIESVLDVGCGTGDLLEYLDEQGIVLSAYGGVDIMPEMVQTAKERWEGREDVAFDCFDILEQRIPYRTYDHVVSIAAYALKAPHDSQQQNIEYVQSSIEEMAKIATKSVFVTLFSTWKTNIIPEEMVLDPVTMFAWAKSKWERVDLIHSYAPFDFSLVIHLDKSEWRREWEKQGRQ